MSTVETELRLADIIRGFLEDDEKPDVKRIAEEIAASIPEHVLRQIVLEPSMLPQAIRHLLRLEGYHARQVIERHALSPGKWEQAANNQDVIDLLRSRITVRGQQKLFGDCTRKDIVDLVVERKIQARGLLRQIKRLEDFDAELVKRRKKRIGDLPHDAIRRIVAEGDHGA